MTEHNNPPAFPQHYLKCEEHMTGMTMLDHFAGLAMQAMVNRESRWEENGIAEEAYKQADAMLKERQSWIK